MRIKKYIAEFVGTFVLVFAACGTAVIVGQKTTQSGASTVGYLITALAFGLVIVAMAYSIGNVSGCHINPAVSLGVLITGGMDFTDFIGYIIAQFAGATAGAAVLKGILGTKSDTLGSNALYEGSVPKSFIIEAILTCIFVIAILGVTSKPDFGSAAGLVIGGALTLVHLLGIPFTGTSVNPARSFGPAILSGSTEGLWVFIVAPLVGAAIAAVFYILVLKPARKKAPAGKKK